MYLCKENNDGMANEQPSDERPVASEDLCSQEEDNGLSNSHDPPTSSVHLGPSMFMPSSEQFLMHDFS